MIAWKVARVSIEYGKDSSEYDNAAVWECIPVDLQETIWKISVLNFFFVREEDTQNSWSQLMCRTVSKNKHGQHICSITILAISFIFLEI